MRASYDVQLHAARDSNKYGKRTMSTHKSFVAWYLSQLCRHGPESIVVAGNLMVCLRCHKQMAITPDLIARYEEHCRETV